MSNFNHPLCQIEMACGGVAEVTSARQFPIVQEWTLEEGALFDAERDIDGTTVTLHPPDIVIIKRVIDGGRHLIYRYAGGPLCVIAVRHLKRSEVKLS